MPELPEVETVRRGLEPVIVGKQFKRVSVFRRDLRSPITYGLEEMLTGKKIVGIRRRAKYLLFDIENAGIMLVHLGMSGTLTLVHPQKHVRRTHEHVWWDIDSKTRMVFHDPRRFGLVLFMAVTDEASHPLLAHLGIEPLSNDWNEAALIHMMKTRKAPIKTALMDQKLVVGVGNIYASESLFLAGIHPQTLASIAIKHAHALAPAVVNVLNAALASGGSTLRDFVRSSGDSGYFQHQFSVYDRQGLPCVICATPIEKIVQANRSSFFCPKCQSK